MTKLLKRLEPKEASKELECRSPLERRSLYHQVASETARGVLAVVIAVLTFCTLVIIAGQQIQLSKAIEKLDNNYNVTVTTADKLTDISILAAYCAKLPGSNTVAQIQQCIETNLEDSKRGNKR